MCFNRSLLVFLVLVLGCGPKFGESPQEVGLRIGNDLNCLSGVKEKVARYLDGKSDQRQVSQLMSCASRALYFFSTYTKGSRADGYTAGDFKRFLEKFYLDGEKISRRFLTELLGLKKAVIGGRVATLTRAEINWMRHFIDKIKIEAIDLLPHIKSLRMLDLRHTTFREVDQASKALVRSANRVGAILQEVSRFYSFARLRRFFEEMGDFFHGPGVQGSRPEKFIPVFKWLKTILVGRPEKGILPDDWLPLLRSSADWYGWAVRLAYFMEKAKGVHDSKLLYGTRLDQLEVIFNELYRLITAAIKSRPPREQVIEFRDINRLIDALSEEGVGVFPRVLHQKRPTTFKVPTAATLKRFLKSFVQNVLGGPYYGWEGRDADGLTIGALTYLKERVGQWILSQRYLDRLFTHVNQEASSLVETRVGKARLLSAIDELGWSAFDPTTAKAKAVADLKQMILRFRPMFAPGTALVDFTTGYAGTEYSYSSLTRLNWIKELVRNFIHGYAEDPLRARLGLGFTVDELRRLYVDWQRLGIELKWFNSDPEKGRLSPIKRFAEGNLFSFHGDGNHLLDWVESTELLSLLFSAKSLAVRAHEEIAKICPATNLKDPYDFPLVGAKCYRKRFFDDVLKTCNGKQPEFTLTVMPGMNKFYCGLTDAERKRFSRELEQLARSSGFSDDHFNLMDSEGYALILHYVETMMLRFDKDRSGVLEFDSGETYAGQEIHDAFPIFRQTLEEVSGYKDEDRLFAIFTYILYEGVAPSGIFDSIDFLLWEWIYSWDLQIDRGRILDILAELSRQKASQEEKQIIKERTVDPQEKNKPDAHPDPWHKRRLYR